MATSSLLLPWFMKMPLRWNGTVKDFVKMSAAPKYKDGDSLVASHHLWKPPSKVTNKYAAKIAVNNAGIFSSGNAQPSEEWVFVCHQRYKFRMCWLAYSLLQLSCLGTLCTGTQFALEMGCYTMSMKCLRWFNVKCCIWYNLKSGLVVVPMYPATSEVHTGLFTKNKFGCSVYMFIYCVSFRWVLCK